MKKTILLMGPPGTGKGTIAQMLVDDLNLCHISTGDIFRTNIKGQTPVGKKALKYINNGQLVPDVITDEMVRLRLQEDDASNKTILMDGYPRNLHQGQKIIELILGINRKIDAVIWLNTDVESLIQRITNRRLCKDCGRIYNLINLSQKPKIDNKCDKCEGDLYQRSDDNAEFVKKRFAEYQQTTLPLLDFYQKKVEVVEIDTTTGSIEENYHIIKEVIYK